MLLSGIQAAFLALGYLLIGIFIAVERALRKNASSKTLQRGNFDRGSTLLIGTSFGIGLLLPVVLDGWGMGLFSFNLLGYMLAIVMMLGGLGLRVWAARSLGSYYTRTLLTTEGQKVVTAGPYARIRHPGYLGDLLLWCGFGVLTSNIVAATLFPLVFVAVYLYRISVEERMLVQTLGEEYSGYRRRTRRLIPFAY